MTRKKVDIATLRAKKAKNEAITMLTAYDAPTARAEDEAGVDLILVGDSAANVVLGYPDTIPVGMDEMLMLTAAVARGNQTAMVIGDMPFLSYQISPEEAIRNAGRFMKEARADAVKLEGGGPLADTVRRIVQAGIPLMGHLGLTPQSAQLLGGYRVQGATAKNALAIVEDALRLQDAGAFSLVLECIPSRVGELISSKLEIPVIGIGAGTQCDGQVLVIHDILGIRSGFTPKFVKTYESLGESMASAISAYVGEVQSRSFPGEEHGFAIKDDEFNALQDLVAKL